MRSRTTMSPSRPTAAIVTASTSGFTVMAMTPGCGATTGEGRPTRFVGSGARSSTSPASTSSAESAGDGRAVEAGRLGEAGARERTLEVHEPQEFREVSTVHPVERAGSLCHATTLGARPDARLRGAPNMLRLTPNARPRSIRLVQITFDVGVETFERFNDEQTQHQEARHMRCRRGTGRRHARRLRRQEEATTRAP